MRFYIYKKINSHYIIMNSIENFIFKEQKISETYNKENFTLASNH